MNSPCCQVFTPHSKTLNISILSLCLTSGDKLHEILLHGVCHQVHQMNLKATADNVGAGFFATFNLRNPEPYRGRRVLRTLIRDVSAGSQEDECPRCVSSVTASGETICPPLLDPLVRIHLWKDPLGMNFPSIHRRTLCRQPAHKEAGNKRVYDPWQHVLISWASFFLAVPEVSCACATTWPSR